MTRAVLGRVAWATAMVLASVGLLSFYAHPLGWAAGTGLAALAILSAVRPFSALLISAALGPLATVLFVVGGVRAEGLRIGESMAFAFIAGGVARCIADPSPLRASPLIRWSAGVLMLMALASAVVSGGRILTEAGGQPPLQLLDDLFMYYAVHVDAVTFALLFAESIALVLVAADICAGDDLRVDAVMRMLVVGAAATAVFSLHTLLTLAIRQEDPWRTFFASLVSRRINALYGDLNAAGSYFALMLFLAMGVVRRTPAVGVVCLCLIGSGLWLAGSRVALAVVFVIGGVLLAGLFGPRRKMLAVAASVLLMSVAAVGVLGRYSVARHTADPSLATRIRLGLSTGAIAMTADHPVFGVGLGRFYELSDRYARVPFYIVRENAHNNYLQILAELGIPGLVVFLAVVGGALLACRRAREPPWALVAGICAFLLTCVAGHPLLVAQVAFPFCIALGLAASSAPIGPANRSLRTAGVVIGLLLIGTVPWRTSAAVRWAHLEGTSLGFTRWQHDAQGHRFRWAGGRATFYISSDERTVSLPLRHSSATFGALEVRVVLEGKVATRAVLNPGEDWKVVRVVLARRPAGRFFRVDLETGLAGAGTPLDIKATDTGGLIAVRRPHFER